MQGRYFLTAMIFIFLLTIYDAKIKAQGLDSLAGLVNSIQRGENDSVRLAANKIFLRGFEKILQEKGSFTLSFDSLKNISVVSPQDKSFRIYTWVVPHYAGDQYDYFGFLQVKSKAGDSI